ncbi:MAG: S9 family peptidase [Acidimicrobiia bacterium]
MPALRTITPAMVAYGGSVGDPRWSPDARRLAWAQTTPGRTDVVVAELGVAPASELGPAMVVTADLASSRPHPMSGGVLAWAGTDELVVCGRGGVLAVVSADGGPARVLSIEGHASAPAVSRDGRWVAFVCETETTCRIGVMPLDGSQPPVMVSDADFAFDPQWAPDGQQLVWHAWDLPNMPFHDSRIECAAWNGVVRGEITTLVSGDGIAVAQPRYSPDGAFLAYCSDADGAMHVHVCELATGLTRKLATNGEHATPSWGVGMRTYAWSPVGHTLAINVNDQGFGSLHCVDLEGDAEPRVVAKAWHVGIDWSEAGIVAVRSGAKTPRQIVRYRNIESSIPDRTVVAVGAPAGFRPLVEPIPVEWERDGESVYGLWWQPPDVVCPPVLVHIHGGPTDQARADWDARRAFFVANGWAVFAPNPHGSTGYGRRYADGLRGAWGEVDIADIAAGIRDVVARQGADPTRVVAMGGSSGGYAVLRLCIEYPECIAGAVSAYGVTDLRGLAETTWRYESGYSDWLVGDLTMNADRYQARSPVYHADRMRTPLLLLQGDADIVVPLAQHESLVAALRAVGAPFEEHVYEGEGHGWSKPETTMDELQRIMEFITRVTAAS